MRGRREMGWSTKIKVVSHARSLFSPLALFFNSINCKFKFQEDGLLFIYSSQKLPISSRPVARSTRPTSYPLRATEAGRSLRVLLRWRTMRRNHAAQNVQQPQVDTMVSTHARTLVASPNTSRVGQSEFEMLMTPRVHRSRT